MISMKNIFNYLLIATLLIGTAVSFSSCKDDDKENENIPVNNGGGTGTTSSTYNIIGTWKCSYDNVSDLFPHTPAYNLFPYTVDIYGIVSTLLRR